MRNFSLLGIVLLLIVFLLFSCSLSFTPPDGTQNTNNDNSTTSNQVPTALITAVSIALTGAEITFSADTSIDSDGTINSYSWDFGDTATSSEQSPKHTYNTSGTFNISLTVTDNDGATNTASHSIVVKDGLIAVASNKSAIENELITFDGTLSQTAGGTITDYIWDFGDGLTGTGATVVHRYSASGTYNASLTVTNDLSQTDTIDLIVDISVPANISPIASISGPTSVIIGETVIYIGSASMDPDGTIASYSWDFGDGTALVSTPIASHSYTSSGNFTLSLTVTDDDGKTDTIEKNVVVETSPNQLPTAVAGSNKTITVGESLTFDGTLSSDPDDTIVSYLWDFGDYSSSTDISPTKLFDTAGIFTITLTVTDSNGGTASDISTITVLTTNDPKPIVDAGADVDVIVNYGDTSISIPLIGAVNSDYSITSYLWKDLSSFQSMTYNIEDSSQLTTNVVLTNFDSNWQNPEFDDHFLIRLQLQVTDMNGNIGFDEILIRVYVYSRLNIIGE